VASQNLDAVCPFVVGLSSSRLEIARGYASAPKLIFVNLIAQRANRYSEYVGSVGPISSSRSQRFANKFAFDRLNRTADKVSDQLKFRLREFRRAKENFRYR